MYGHVELCPEGKGWRSVLSAQQVGGMTLLRAQVSAPPGLRRRALLRRLRRAGERLWAEGVNRVLVAADFPHALWEPLEQAGLAGVETAPLCRAQAGLLVLALLRRRGVEPERATVCLAGESAVGEVQRAAELLAPRVARLVIDCPRQGTELARWLRREYGLPLVEPGSLRADVTAAFAPDRDGVRADLRLCGRAPELAGLRLEPEEGALPEGFAPLPFMAALWECGQLPPLTVRDTLV